MQSIVIFHCVISAPFVVFCKSECPLHPLKPCKNSAETVHLLWDKWQMMIFDPWPDGGLSDHKGKFDTRKEECPLVWGVLRGVGISAQAVNIISIMIIQIILTCSNKILVLPIFRFAKRFYFLLSYKLIHSILRRFDNAKTTEIPDDGIGTRNLHIEELSHIDGMKRVFVSVSFEKP